MRTTRRLLFALALSALPAASGAVPARPGVVTKASVDAARILAAGLDRPVTRVAGLPRRTLVLLVEFPDAPHADQHTPANVEGAWFGDTESVRAYYASSSFGRYAPAGAVQPWIRLERTRDFYTDGSAGIGGRDPRNARRMVADLVRAADAACDFSQFDNDGPDGIPASGDDDGRVDALMVVHAGETQEETGRLDRFLSHAWFTPAPVVTDDGVDVWEYALVGAGSPLGVRAHEFGHLLGLPDLYDRAALFQSASGGLGSWSLMAAGAWLGEGARPGDLDAPSKIQLGFVDPVVPTANSSAPLRLRARSGAQPPDVYQVWTHGRIGPEFLVLVNRRRTDLDVELPGGGMLVYHVNTAQATNDTPTDLRVQLLQADGRGDVEGFVNNGDALDPWPGTGIACCRIDADTTPSTRARDGSASQITISNISSPSAEMSFELVLETRALLRVERHTLREQDGDGDGVPEPDERLAFDVTVENLGLRSAAFDLVWRSDPVSAAAWDTDRASFPELAKGERAEATFVLRPAATLADPSALRLVGAATETNGTRHVLARELGLGASAGLLACFDAPPSAVTRDCGDPAAPWTIDVLRGDAGWSLETSSGDLGLVYRSARGPRYPNGADVALVTPAFNLDVGQELQLLHDYDLEPLARGWAHDGGRVEIALHGGEWEALEPRAGYTHRVFPESVPYLAGAGVFSGSGARRWDVFDLGGRTGSARIRFRFVSNDSIGAGGWRLARVEVRDPLDDAGVSTTLRVVAEPNPVRFPTRVVFEARAPRTENARPTRLLIFDVRGRRVRELTHAPVPAQSARFIWDGMDHAGRDVPSGVYWTRLEWGRDAATAKLVVIR